MLPSSLVRTLRQCRLLSSRTQPCRASCALVSAQPAKRALTSSFIKPASNRSCLFAAQVATAEPDMVASNQSSDERLAKFRELLAKADKGKGVDAYIIPTEDPHMSEYSTASDERRHFLSGFTGSAGTAVVTKDKALLWTDGRYFLQAEKQLGKGWQLMRGGTPGCPDIPDWLADNLPEGARVGVDPYLHTVNSAKQLQTALEDAGKILVPLLEGNLVDNLWGDARPAASTAGLRIHALERAGETVADKIKRLRSSIKDAKAGALLVTALDEIAWLLNLRGSDISYNPVFVSYVILTFDSATLYVDKSKISGDVSSQLEEAEVVVKPYDAVADDIKTIAVKGTKLWMDPAKVSFAMNQIASDAATAGPRGKGRKRTRSENGTEPKKVTFVEKPSPISAAKAVKNAAELEGMREAHLRDSVALATTFHWLEEEIAAGRSVSEVEVDDFLTGKRKAQAGFIEPSFPTIAGAGPNGAIIHYRAEPATAGTVDGNTLLLVDSGGQYDCGTTDVTRTFHLGEPSEHQKMCFSRVLQGHIAIDRAVFPEGTPGLALDSFARASLWSQGLNYRHGTGHGVGAALNVHEGPHSISSRYGITVPLMKGMVVSNEPGYYEDGSFGIRIENLLIVDEANTPHRFGGVSYFGFERLTFCPLQRKMLSMEVLKDSEVDWINDYHKQVWEKVSPRIKDEKVLKWLKDNTEPLQVPQMIPA